MNIGRKLFYDLQTGDVIFDTGERSGNVVELTDDEWIERIEALNVRVRDTFGTIELDYGDFAQDFAGCNGYKVDVASGALVFSYPDPSAPDAPPVYQPPLSVKVAEQETRIADLELALADLFTA